MTILTKNIEHQLVDAVPRLRQLAYALTASKSDSDDLVQSTVERALTRQHQCTDVAKVENWAFSILHSIWKNELRSRHVRRGNGIEDVGELVDERQPEQQYELEMLRQAAMNLPVHYRSVVILVDVYGMSYQETAEMLDIKLGTVMSRLSRARNQLLAVYSKYSHGKHPVPDLELQ